MSLSNISEQLMPGEKILIEERQHWLALFPFFWPPKWLRWFKTSVAITNKRIIAISGVFSPDTFEARLNKVASIKLNQTLMGRMLNFGTIVLNNFGGEAFTYKSMENAKEMRRIFNEALEEMENPHPKQ